jgi:transcriptional regulator with XRE-family HTH domain
VSSTVGDLRAAFGVRLRKLRLARKLTLEQLAERADLHWTYVSGIERGRRDPGLRTLSRLAHALELSLGELLGTLDAAPASPAPRAVRSTRKEPVAVTPVAVSRLLRIIHAVTRPSG